MVEINGAPQDVQGRTLTDVLVDLGFDPMKIAVERNGDIVPRATYGHTILEDGDHLEVVRFVGGG
ncbi:MAG: sulfur carrier protein ThiS [Oscillospiraceae bacterium]|nr:sulfur carrier protein ThiS [Oscillospiraceae bacterium]